MPSCTCFFICIACPPQRPTLFPYTTLFRSLRECWRVLRPGGRLLVADWEEEPKGLEAIVTYPWRLDRKSTRLNSSHVEISYAVFCLKKKNYLQQEFNR